MKNLTSTAISLWPFLPAKNFELSKQFYLDLGFSIAHENRDTIGFAMGGQGFLLQNFYIKELADNFMIHLLVSDVGTWWNHALSLSLNEKYGVSVPKPPKDEPWGLKVLYLTDPSGVLWHVAQKIQQPA